MTPAPFVRLAGARPLVATERRPDAIPVSPRDRQLPLACEVHTASTVTPHELIERRGVLGEGMIRGYTKRQVLMLLQPDVSRALQDEGLEPHLGVNIQLGQLMDSRRYASEAKHRFCRSPL